MDCLKDSGGTVSSSSTAITLTVNTVFSCTTALSYGSSNTDPLTDAYSSSSGATSIGDFNSYFNNADSANDGSGSCDAVTCSLMAGDCSAA